MLDRQKTSEPEELLPPAPSTTRRSWLVALTGFIFIVLQSACTAVIAISGVRVAIGVGSLAAASGLNRPAGGFHADRFRIPMMLVALAGSLVNLYVVWRLRSLRSRTSSSWRLAPVSPSQLRSERIQIALAILTLLLVAAEFYTHHIVHNV